MDINEEAEIKREFQLERVILFSDAVFAIIITLMVLDIKLPDGFRHANAAQVKHAFVGLIPKVVSYCVSFFLVSKFWRNHLKIFSLLKDYDNKLLAYNLFYLFSVSFFPFAVTLTSGGSDLESMQFAWAGYTYVGIFLLCSFSRTMLTVYLVNNKHRLCFDTSNLDKILEYRAIRLNFYLIPAVIIAMFIINYFALQPVYAMYTVAVYGIVISRFRKKFYPEKDKGDPFLSRIFRTRKAKLINLHTNTNLADKP